MAARGKLPNLKICVDNTESTDESDVSVHDSGSESSEDEADRQFEDSKKTRGLRERELPEDNVLSIETQPTVRKFLSRGAPSKLQNYGPKIYENKSGNFVTGVDVTSEEAQEMRDKRAQRFGTLSTPKHPITDVDIKNLYRSLGLSIDKLAEDPRGWRMEAILLRGTDNMSTEDVFKYFSEFGPKGIEWIDDSSCNILWSDKLTPARALLRLSSSMDEVHLAEKIVDNQMEDQEGDQQAKKTGSGNVNSGEKAPQETVESTAKETADMTEVQSSNKETSFHDEPSMHEKSDVAIPAVLAGDEIAMELDFDDDNIDLCAEDPIDQALSTWSNFTQNKEQRAQRRASDAAIAKTRQEEEDARKKGAQGDTREKGQLETMSAGKEKSREVSEKEKQASCLMEKDKDESRPSTASKGDNRAISSSKKSGKEKSERVKAGKDSNKKDAATVGEIKIKEEKEDKPKHGSKKVEKMEEDGEVSGSDSGSSSSSSSSSSGSSSSSSGSGNNSSSDSSSSSSSTSSSSSPSGNSSEGSKKKKLKSHSERDKERALKKTTKKPEERPAIPQVKEESEVPWPPGFWRLGMPCTKAEYLFMRYAMKADKKLPGAEKKSEYYKKYGNPNFGGATGLISNSRKRRLRQKMNKGDEEDALAGVDSESVHREETGKPQRSRLAGRLGVRAERRKRHPSGEEPGATEDRVKVPALREGKDLRDLLNGDPTAVKDESEGNTPVKQKTAKDSEDEMDYGAELERLMAKDEEEEPPIKKRFMRMHADDEEAKIKTKRLAKAAAQSPKWQKDMYDEREGMYPENEDQEEEEEEEGVHQMGYPSVEVSNPLSGQGSRGYVDYDNVEDDDPFNLFGTAAPKESLPIVSSGGHRSDEENNDRDFDDSFYLRRRGYVDSDEDDWRDDRDSWRKSSRGDRDGGGSRVGGGGGGGGLDLRAKLQAKRRAGNRNW